MQRPITPPGVDITRRYEFLCGPRARRCLGIPLCFHETFAASPRRAPRCPNVLASLRWKLSRRTSTRWRTYLFQLPRLAAETLCPSPHILGRSVEVVPYDGPNSGTRALSDERVDQSSAQTTLDRGACREMSGTYEKGVDGHGANRRHDRRGPSRAVCSTRQKPEKGVRRACADRRDAGVLFCSAPAARSGHRMWGRQSIEFR